VPVRRRGAARRPPECHAPDAVARAEEWRTACAALRVESGEHSLGITVSAGVAAAPEDGTDPVTVLAAADLALYEAKHTGRDRVVAARPRPSGPR
jgi:diguanylate cyclase (GGDEF)-like protein